MTGKKESIIKPPFYIALAEENNFKFLNSLSYTVTIVLPNLFVFQVLYDVIRGNDLIWKIISL